MSAAYICDGCDEIHPLVRGVCAMCRANGVPMRPGPKARAKARKALLTTANCKTPDSFPTTARNRARADAIRAEDPAGWAAAIGHRVSTFVPTQYTPSGRAEDVSDDAG